MLPFYLLIQSLFIYYYKLKKILEYIINLQIQTTYKMKFLTLAAICAFTSAVSSLKIQPSNSHFNTELDHQKQTNDQGEFKGGEKKPNSGEDKVWPSKGNSQWAKGSKDQHPPLPSQAQKHQRYEPRDKRAEQEFNDDQQHDLFTENQNNFQHLKKDKGGKADKGDKQKDQKNQFDWSTFTSPCTKEDTACWKKWFSEKLPCKTQDRKCWKQSNNKLPCPLFVKKCWTEHITTFPCQPVDNTCWDSILPQTLPCKAGDKQCWKKLKKEDKNKGKDKKDKGDKGKKQKDEKNDKGKKQKDEKNDKGEKQKDDKKQNHDLQDYLESLNHNEEYLHQQELYQHDQQLHDGVDQSHVLFE